MGHIDGIGTELFELCLGGNVFGWTADRDESFAVLDAYRAAGGNVVDTAELYGNGASETIIGEWMAARGNRDEMVIATKVGYDHDLSPDRIRRSAEASLERLRTDRIDLYYAHTDDPDTSQEATLGAFDALVREGKVRAIGASNYSAPRLAEALAVSRREGLVRYTALQPHYNLLERSQYEGELEELCRRERIACLPYFALAKGFLTGKYRPGGAEVESPRAPRASEYLDARGERVLAAVDEVAAAHGTSVAAVALAWLRAQPTVAAPIASARTPEQLADLLPSVTLELDAAELRRLDEASAER